MELLLWSLALLASLFVLVKSADYFTLWSEKLGLFFGLSWFIVWATIVSVWSSMPEIVTSTLWVLDWKTNFPVDNIIGSNIANILLIWGISWVVATKLMVNKELIDVDLPFFFISTGLFIYFVHDGIFTWKEWISSLVILLIFILYTLSTKSKIEWKRENRKLETKHILFIVLWVVWIYFWAEYTLTSVYKISDLLSIPPAVVTIFAVAIWTSLPELVISIQAVKAKKYSIALWNIFWSNTFNALAVSAIPSFFGDLTVSQSVLTVWLPFLWIATIWFIFSTMDNKVERWEALLMLAVYLIFTWKIIWIL